MTRRPSRHLPDDTDGRALFDAVTSRRRALEADRADTGGVASPGGIVAVPPVRQARDAGLLEPRPMFSRLTPNGVVRADGAAAESGAAIWCTGFRPALSPLAPLDLRGPHGRITTTGTRAVAEPRPHLLGYGDRTGPASATLVGRPAREAACRIADYPARPTPRHRAAVG
ncbi:hypothetical protein GCM10010446_19550 [Streptomyces enissocaesilis]|uniref:Uncharacterized protein n=1 Tax=Streptomyces enissocaesilis TaxID=332589 RepID=A0ABN3X2L2_9ACTN